ncbi:hypothetical protein DLREEDagr8_08650 [Dongia sp. agr-C8]
MASGRLSNVGEAKVLLTAGALLVGAGLAGWSAPALAITGKERLAGRLVLMTTEQAQASDLVPKLDKKRTAECLAKAIVADIPEADAAKLADILDRRAPNDPALQKKWFTISKKEAPARNAQVLKAVDKLCPDIGPYAKRML